MKIWRMRTAWRIPKAKITHSDHVIIMAFPLQQCLHERASMVGSYVHCLPCYRMSKIVCVCVCVYIYICKNGGNFGK